MKANELRRLFIDFFVKRGHTEIKSSSLIPENDPTVLFTTAGMHPLVPYLMGEVHPSGKRLVDLQKCVRTDDIDEVGDATHCTFFEMLGNWSLGDYFKEDAIKWSYEFLTSSLENGGLGLDPDRLMVSCFEGDKDAPKDMAAADVWINLGFTPANEAKPGQKKLINFYEKKKNWWGPAGQIGPCGPDTEMFYDMCPELEIGMHKKGSSLGGKCHPNCDCGRYTEIWNDVFMQYNKMPDGSFVPLKQQNVDTGMGFERVLAIMNGAPSHYETELFKPIIEKIRELAKEGGVDTEIWEAAIVNIRIIADHIRAATFIMGDPWGVTPSNKDQGYILRRLIRRAIRQAKFLGITGEFTSKLGEIVIDIYKDVYPELRARRDQIIDEFKLEEEKFQKTIEHGLREMKKIWDQKTCDQGLVQDGDKAFYVYETYGFPVEMIVEELVKMGYKIESNIFKKRFDEAQKAHQGKSRAGSEMKFAGGLADHSEETTKLHTATHLLHKALRIVLGEGVEQRGSNITAERLRFDFSYPQKMTPEQIKQVEDIVNEQIQKDLAVEFELTTVEEAKGKGAIGLFESKYGEKVKTYKIGDFSYEICGGPHMESIGQLKKFKILKEEASSAGIRRIKAGVVGAGIKD